MTEGILFRLGVFYYAAGVVEFVHGEYKLTVSKGEPGCDVSVLKGNSVTSCTRGREDVDCAQ